MATETHIPESVYLKIGEKEDNALSSEILEEKVIELVGNKVKHVESSRQVAETENTQVEAGIPTNESGTFFQALSVPMVSSNTPESFDAATSKDQDPKFVKTSESVEEITPSVEIKNEGLHDGITTDVCVLTKTEAKAETIENEEKNDEKAFEKEACEETGTEKDESAVGLKFSDSMAPSKQEGDRDGVTSTPDETCEDIKETTTTVAGIKEQDLNEMPKEFVKQETEDKSIDTQEAIEQWESVKKIEQEEETEEIKPSVEIEEKMDAITTDACISTQIKSQVENTEHEEMDEEKATQSDDGQKEKSGIPSVKDVCKDNSSEKVENENSGIKLNDEEREQVVNVLEKDQGEDVVTSAQDVSFEGNEREVVTGKESIEEDTKETRSSVETTDVCSSTQTKPEEETTKKEEKNDEETIESDDGQTNKSGSHMVKEVCEETFSEMTESEEGLKPSESSSMVLTENEIARKDEDQEMEQELYVSEKDQTESQVKTTKLEGGHAEVTESDDGQKENSESILIKEVCEETNYEKVESERVELSDSSGIKQNEKAITTLSNDEVQEKEQDQDEDDITWHDGTNADVCVSTQAELEKETKENEDKNDAKPIQKEVCEETSPEKAESEVVYQLSDSMVPSKKEDLNTVEKDKCDSDGVTSSQDTTCEDIKETTPDQFAATVADFKEQDLNEFLKEEIEDKSTDAQQASEECQNGENDKTEQKPEESVKHEDQENKQEVNILEKDQVKDDFTSTQDVSVEGGLQEKTYHVEDIEREIVKERESIEEDTLEIKSSAETPEKKEQHRLINAVSTDVCISTQTEPNETTETQEKNDEEAIESDDGQTKKPGIPMVEEICEETVLEKHEKAESEEGLKLSNSTSMVLNEKEIMSKDEYQVQELYLSEKDQSGGNDVTISQNESNEDIKETTIGHAATVAGLEEEAEDKAIDAQEASEQYEDRANDNKEQNSEDSVKDIVHSFSKIEHEEYTEEIKPSVETNEEKNVCISTQKESQEDATQNEEKAIEDDDDLKEKSENPFVKEVHEETDLKKTESEEDIKLSDTSKMNLNEKAVEIISKDEDQENEQEPAVFEDELQGNNNDGECNELKNFQIRESIKGDNEDIRASVETEEIMEQQGSLHDITSDVSLLTQKESQEDTTKNEEKNEEPIESDDGWKEKHDIPSVEEVCEETSLEKVESEEGLELHDSLNMKIKEKTITFKDEDHENDQEVNTQEEVQDKDNVTSSHDAISKEEEDLQQNYHNESNEPEFFKTRENVDEEIKYSVEKKENSEQQGFSHVTTNDVCSSTQAKEETTKNEARLDAENQTDSTEDKSEIEDEVVSTEKASEQYEDRANNNREQNPEDSVKDIVHSFSKIEHEEYTEEIKPSVETNEEKNVCISTQTESQEEATKNEEKAIEGDDDLKEKSENPFVKEVREETDLKKTESEEEIKVSDTSKMNLNEKAVEIISKDEDQENEQEPAVFEDELQGNNNDGECNEIKKFQIRESIKGDNEDIRASVETEEIMEQQGSLHDITSDVSLLTQNESQEDTTKNEEKNEEPIESDDGWKEKHDIPSVEEVCEETSLEKVESEEGLELHDSLNMKINEKTITFKDEDHEKDQEVNTPEEVQDKDNVTSSHDAISKEEEDLQQKNYHNESNEPEFFKTRENVDEEIKSSVEKKEISEQQGFSHVTTNDVCSSTQAKEETIKNEARLDAENQADSTEDKSEIEDEVVSTEKASEQYEDRANNNREQNPEDSVKDIVHSFSKIEHEEYTEEIKPSVETNEEKNVCISTQTESQEEATKNEEKAIEGDDDLKEKSENPFVKEVREETDLKKTESEEEIKVSDTSKMNLNEKAVEIISKDEDQENEQEPAVFEDELQGNNNDGECNEIKKFQIRESIKGDNEDIRASVETEEIMEQQGSLHDITSDVSLLTQNESQEDTTKNEEKNEEPIESDDGWKEKHDIPSVEEVCEETSLEKVESEEGLELHDSLNMKINEKTITFKDEDHEKDQEVNTPEAVQDKDNVTSSHDAISKEEEDLQQKNYHNESNEPEFFKTRENVDEEIKSSVEKKENSEQQGFSHVTTNDVCSSTQAKEENIKNEARLDAENEADSTEDKSEMGDEALLTEKMSSEEQNGEEIEACLTKTTEVEVTKKDEDSSHISIQDTNDGTTKEEKCFLYESRDIEISTLDHEPTEEQNSGLDKVLKENFTDLNEITVVEPQDTPSSSLEPSTKDTSNSEKAKAESEILPIEDLESVTEIQIPDVVPKSEDSKLISVRGMHLDEEKETVTEENSSDEKTEQPTQIKKETFEEACEETSSEKAELEEVIKKCENGDKNKREEKPAESDKLEDQEKEQEVHMLEKDQGEDEITSAQDVAFEGGVEDRNHHSEGNEHEVVKTKERIVEDVEEIRSSVEAPDRAEQQRLINVIPTDVCITTQTEPEEKTTENEEKNNEKATCQEIVKEKVETEEGGEDNFQSSKNASNEDINESTHDQYATTVANFEEEKSESVMTEEIIREKAEDNSIDAQEMSSDLRQPKEQNLKIGAFLTTTTNEKTEDEITKKDEDSSHDSMDDTNDNTIKEEKCTLEHEPMEEQNGRRFDEVSKENLMDLYDTTAVKHQEDVTPSGTLGTLTEDTSNSEKAKAESEVLPIGDLESVSEIQIPEVVPNSEDSNLIEGCLISPTAMHVDEEKETVRKENSSDEKTEQTTEIKQETFEKTSSEKAGSEGFKISDSSNMEINEKVMTTFNDEDQEKGQEVNISAEGQGMDNVTNAQDANFEEDLQEKNYQNKDNEHKFVETRESIDEDTTEIISSVETKELKSESPFFTEVLCEATSSEKAEPEDGVKHSESFNMKVVEDEIVSKEENLEKKQELTMSEVQGGRDDVIISDNVSNEDIKETTTGQRATTVVDFEEGQDLSPTTKEILVEEAAEDKSVDAQEASEPCENEGKDKSEQNPEESVDKPVKSCLEDRSELKDEFVSTEKMPSEYGQPKEQNIEEIEACLITRQEKRPLEYEPAEEQHGSLDEVSKENLTNLYETTTVEPQEDITPSNSLGTSTEDASAKAESENLPIEDLESVSQVQIPEVVPKSADVKAKEECLMSEAATKEILRDENPEAYGERELTFESTDDDHINETIQQADKSYITTEENVSQLGQIGDNDSPYEKRDTEEDGTQENQLNSTEECGEMLKDAFLTEKISYSDPIPVTNREVTQVRVDTQIGQEDLQATEDISRESYVKNDNVDEAPKKEIIPSLEEVKTIEPEVNLSNIESTAYPSESEKLPTPALEYVCDVQAREISADSEDREVKEECIVLATAQYTDENRVEEEEKNNTNEILSVLAEENVMQVPEEKSDLNREEKASTEESLELHGELKPASESIIEEDKVNKIESQPEQSDIASENIMNDQESKLEHMTEKDLEDGKREMEEDLTLAPENQIKSIENYNDIMKNVILTDEDDKRLTELDKTSTSTSNQKELANEIELSKPILVENTKVTELKAESQIELENIQPAEVKDVSADEPLKDEIIQVLEDGKALELQVNLPEIESRDTPSNEQDMPCSTQETVEEKGVRVSHLTDREILVAPDVEFEKKEKDVQTPEAILSEEHPEATNDTCETLIGGESSEKKLISMVPPEGNTSPTVEDQANELVPETDKTEVEHSSISNTDQNPKFTEEGFTETFSEDQTSIKERYIEVERKGNFAVANKEEKSGNEVVEDVIVSEVLLEDETAKESKNIKDNINEEAIHNQLTSATDEVCENERSNSSPDEVVEKKDLVGDTEDPKLMAENLNLKDEPFTVMKASKEDSDLVAPEFESLEKMATEEKIIETDAYEEKETLEVRSEDSRGHGDMIKLEEKENEVSEVAEIVPEGRREASAVLSKNLQEDSPKMILAKYDPEITTATEKIEDKKTGELQVSTLNYETDEGKQNAPGDMQNKEREAVQPQESSEDNTLLSQNDNKIDDSLVLPLVENNTKQGVDTRFEEVPVIDVLKHEKGLDHTTEVKSIDVASNAECSEIEPSHIDTKEATTELINQENQKESDDNIEALIPIEDVKSSTKVKSADLEVLLVMDPNNTKDEAYEAEKGVLNGDEHLESTGDRSKPTEELSGMKQELDAPVTLGIGATDDLKISQKNLTDDLTKISETQPEIQKYEASAACTVDKQSPNEKTAKSLIAEVQDLNAIKASNTLPQCSSEDFKEEEKMSDQKDMSPEPTKVNSEVADQNIIGEREVALTKDEKVDKEEIGEENEEEEDNEKTGDAPVMVEASKDMEVKVHKKSHNILSGVGSKVKHSIAKVKKAITGKSSHQKPPSP